jgi:protein-tyrosine phosphatase
MSGQELELRAEKHPTSDERQRGSATSAIDYAQVYSDKWYRILLRNIRGRSVKAGFLWVVELISRLARGHPIRALSEVRPFLFMGGQHLRRGLSVLESWGISAVLNMRDEFDDQLAGVAKDRYLHLKVVDNTPPTLDQLRRGVAFIEEERRRGGKVYVHCEAGVGRAPTMAAAYLVSTGKSTLEAWEELRDIRPFIRPRRMQRALIQQLADTGWNWETSSPAASVGMS